MDLRGYDNSTMIEDFYYETGAIAFSVFVLASCALKLRNCAS
jgi:hypothetical protein